MCQSLGAWQPFGKLRTGFLAGEGVLFGDGFYGDGVRLNPGGAGVGHHFGVDVVGGFDLEGVAVSGVADVGGLG